jgi:hypothetical protein
MALKKVMGGASGRKSGDMQVGESVEGYLIGTVASKFNFAIKLLTKEGTVETLYPNGNLSYIEEEIEDGNVILNAFTKITRSGTRESKKSRDASGNFRMVPTFEVAQDTDDVILDSQAAEALAADKAAVAAAVAANGDSPDGGSTGKFANRARR